MQQTEENTSEEVVDKLYLTTIGGHSPAILCENHALHFEAMMLQHEVNYTIDPIDEVDGLDMVCQACDLHHELNRPRIILPN